MKTAVEAVGQEPAAPGPAVKTLSPVRREVRMRPAIFAIPAATRY